MARKKSRRLMAILAAAGGAVAVLGLARKGQAQTVYFDPNNPSSPSVTGGSTYSWNTSTSNWSTDPSGVTPGLVAWTNGANAVFVAGSNAAGLTYTVTNAGANSVTVNSGTVIIGTSAGLNYLTTSSINIASGASATWYGSINSGSLSGFTKTGLGTLTFGGYGNGGNDSENSEATVPAQYESSTFAPGTHFSPIYAVNGGTLVLGAVVSGNWLTYTTVTVDSSNSSTMDLGAAGGNKYIAGIGNGPNGGGVVTNNGASTDYLTFMPAKGLNNYFSGSIVQGSSDIGLSMAGFGTQTFAGSGNTTGGLSLVASTLILDYTTNNQAKFGASELLRVNNGKLVILGNNTASTTATFGTLRMQPALGSTGFNVLGASQLQVVSGAGQTTTLALGAMNRYNADMIDFLLTNTSGGTAIVTTTSANNAYGLLGDVGTDNNAYATLNNGADWASVNGSHQIVAPTYNQQNNAANWVGANITSGTNGFSGTLSTASPSVYSLRFNGGGTATLGSSTTLSISSGGLLVTPSVGTNSAALQGGAVSSSLIIQQYNTASDFIIGSQIESTINKAGPGTVVLTNANNSASGFGMNILGGDVAIAANGALGTGAVNIYGGTLELRGVQYGSGPTITFQGDEVSHVNGSTAPALGSLYASGGNVSYGGIVTSAAYEGQWTSAVGVAAGSTLTLTHASISPLFLIGSGQLILGGSSSFNTNSYVYGGTMTLAGSVTDAWAIGTYYGTTLQVDNSGTNVATRTSSYLYIAPGRFLDTGNSNTSSVQIEGGSNGFGQGYGESTCEVQNGGTQLASLTFTCLQYQYGLRSAQGYPTTLFRGNNLGQNATSNSSNIFFSGYNPFGTGGIGQDDGAIGGRRGSAGVGAGEG